MNREKWLFVIVLAIVLLWGGKALTGAYEAAPEPEGRPLAVEIPSVAFDPNTPPPRLLLKVAFGIEGLTSAIPDSGRTLLVPHSDLERMPPAMLPLPPARPTPFVLPPIEPGPGVPEYRWFRTDLVTPVEGGPAEEAPEAMADPDEAEAEDDPDFDFEADVLRSREKWTFVESEHDALRIGAPGSTNIWYGRISLTEEIKKQGFTKYDLLLAENADLPFYFEQIQERDGRILTKGNFTLAGSSVSEVTFSDTIENRYWSRRTTDRVRKDSRDALLGLGRWVMDLADEEAYVRFDGLALAVATFKEALLAKPGDVESTLALGEALHRSFEFDDEMALYDATLAENEASALYVAKARIYTKLGLIELAESVLSKALVVAPGDTQARLRRAEARFEIGHLSGAGGDFEEVMQAGTPEQQLAGRVGRARVLIASGQAEDAERLLAVETDAASLLALGAAKYARGNFAGAQESFEMAAGLDSESALALTCLGFAKAHTAASWQDVEDAMADLTKARDMDPLNYYLPPLGQGFAEWRRGQLTESLDRLTTALAALPTEPYAHYILGVSYLRDGRAADARDEFLTALKLDYRFADALIGAGTAAMDLGLTDTAEGATHWADARGYLNRGLTLEKRAVDEAGSNSEHRKIAQASVMLLNYRLARLYLLCDDKSDTIRLKEAWNHLLEVLKIDERYVPAIMAMGNVAYQQGDVEEALRRFDQARDLSPEGELKKQIERTRQKLLEAESRRQWKDLFDRPDSSKVGNNWSSRGVGTVQPKIQGGRVVVEGRMDETGSITVTRGAKEGLAGKFISAEAIIKTGDSDQVNMAFFIFTRRGNKYGAAVGIERSARGTIVVKERKASSREWSDVNIPDGTGADRVWPGGDVRLRIERVDPEQGTFDLYVNDEKIHTAAVGIRQRGGEMEFGFLMSANQSEQFRAEIEEVRMVRYE